MHPTSNSSSAHTKKLLVDKDGRLEDFSRTKGLGKATVPKRQSSNLHDVPHPDRSRLSKDTVKATVNRFEKRNTTEDIDITIKYFRELLAHCPPGHPVRSIRLDNLASSIFTRFNLMRNVEDLDEAIACFRKSLDLRPAGHLTRPILFNRLISAILTRYERTNKMSDLEEAIAYSRQSVNPCPLDHPYRPTLMNDLASSIYKRFARTGKMRDLEEAIVYFRQSLDAHFPGHPDRPISLNYLADAIRTRFEKAGNMRDLEEAIVHFRQSFNLCPPGHPNHLAALNNLAFAISARFKQTGKMDRFDLLNNLAGVILMRFNQTGKTDDLEEAILYFRQSLDLHPPGHPGHSPLLSNLAAAILQRFEQRGNIDDLEEAILYFRQSLDLHPPGRPGHSSLLSNLAAAILKRSEQRGNMDDLEEAIAYLRQSLNLCPPSDTNRSGSLNNLANAVSARFKHRGKMDDVEEAITCNRQALDLRPPGHVHRPDSLNNLAETIHTRFNHTGRMEDLDEAIVYIRQSLALCPPGHSLRSISLSTLASVCRTRFEQRGKVEDLEEAITRHRQALDLRPPSHPYHSASLNNLASAILARFKQTGRMSDLDEATTYYRQSLDFRPLGHPDRSDTLSNLASVICRRYQQTGKISDLKEAITYYRQSLDLCPPGHQGHPISLNNLANAIFALFKQTGKIEDMKQATAYYRQSLDICPPGHPIRPTLLRNLANVMQICFRLTGKAQYFDDATKYLSEAETCLPANHPLHAQIWSTLATTHLAKYKVDSSDEQLSKAFTLYENSANHYTASLKTRFDVALEWASAASGRKHESTLRAYSTSLTLFERSVISTPTVDSQQKFLASATTIPKSLALDAASSAIEAGQLDTAVEFLERGRAIILSKMRNYRHRLEDLRIIDQKLANDFETLSAQLEYNAMSFESEQVSEGSSVSFEVQQRKHRILSEKWEEVVGRIRKVQGFADFLQAVPFSTLQMAAAEGPVIVVNISQYRSDAIIVRHLKHPILVPLPDALPDDLARLSSKLSDPRASHREDFSIKLSIILRDLWDIIVHPVTDQLATLGVAERTRIWWCPTSYLCALPIHAAGPYMRGKKSLPELYISSYTSTLSALIAARSGMLPRTTVPSVLAIGDVGQPDAPIPSVEEEICRITSFGDFVDVLFGEQSTRDNVISGLQQHSWAHFSCHGHRNPEPFHSSFQVYGGERLELLDLMKARLPNAEHVFLSACHAAAADIKGTPDEVIHLASAMQFCGFRSVVGTMWAMADIDGPDITEDYYGYMFRDLGNVDFRDLAMALNIATRAMRMRKVPLGRWVNFIHIGA